MKRVAKTVADLVPCSRTFDGSERARKMRLLDHLLRDLPKDASELMALHDALLFVVAFPDDAEVRALAERGLREVARAVSRATSKSKRTQRKFAGSGIAGTVVEHSFTLDTLRWLVARARGDVELMWEDDSLGDAFDDLLPHLAWPAEYDGLIETSRSTREWLAIARGSNPEIAWLLAQLDRVRVQKCQDVQLLDHLVDQAEVYVRWTLHERGISRTDCRFPARKTFYHAPRGTVVPDAPRIADVIHSPLPVSKAVGRERAQQLIDIARATLAVRSRETDPVTYAEPRDVFLFNLDRGIDVMLVGLQPGRRLPIEGFVGYVVAKNRVPVAYGGGWMFFDCCTIGINLFEAFRGGESAHIFAQVLRVYRNQFKVQTFLVDPYQIGSGNEEAIRSGAFWFYYRFGFRPIETQLAAIADREAERIAADRTHRTSRATLRRLAAGRLRMDVVGGGRVAEEPISVESVSLALTRSVGDRFGGDWSKAQAAAREFVGGALGATDRDSWPPEERASFESLAPLMALIEDLPAWPESDCRALRSVMRAKGGPRETAYINALRRHRRLRDFMAACAATAEVE